MGRSLLLTGHPGIGKTTIIRKVVEALGNRAGGFYTEEIQGPGGRHGIKLITLYGEEATIAHKDFKAPRYPRVGRYGVDTAALDKVGVKALRRTIKRNRIVIVDGIGLMELHSRKFLDVLMGGLMGDAHIVGTIMTKPHPEADVFRYLAQVEIWEIDLRNRGTMHEHVLAWVNKLQSGPSATSEQ
ncbi:MAG: nucleoside-triphosphatase [Anaerolineae bacterium]|nr:nucleoside-triphosphatase [Anaerolineae bacterium]